MTEPITVEIAFLLQYQPLFQIKAQVPNKQITCFELLKHIVKSISSSLKKGSKRFFSIGKDASRIYMSNTCIQSYELTQPVQKEKLFYNLSKQQYQMLTQTFELDQDQLSQSQKNRKQIQHKDPRKDFMKVKNKKQMQKTADSNNESSSNKIQKQNNSSNKQKIIEEAINNTKIINEQSGHFQHPEMSPQTELDKQTKQTPQVQFQKSIKQSVKKTSLANTHLPPIVSYSNKQQNTNIQLIQLNKLSTLYLAQNEQQNQTHLQKQIQQRNITVVRNPGTNTSESCCQII